MTQGTSQTGATPSYKVHQQCIGPGPRQFNNSTFNSPSAAACQRQTETKSFRGRSTSKSLFDVLWFARQVRATLETRHQKKQDCLVSQIHSGSLQQKEESNRPFKAGLPFFFPSIHRTCHTFPSIVPAATRRQRARFVTSLNPLEIFGFLGLTWTHPSLPLLLRKLWSEP